MLLLSTSSLQWYGLYRIFKFAKQASYTWIDLALTKTNHDMWDEDYVKEVSEHFWIPVLSITAPIRWMDEKKVDKIIKIAQTLKAQIITFSPPHYTDRKKTWYTYYLKRVKKNTTIWLSIRNVDSKFIFFIIPEYKNSTLTEIKSVTWNTTLDLWSLDKSSAIDIMKAQKILWWTIKNVFLNDKRASRAWLLPGQAWWWTSFLPIESFLMKLKSIWYTWFITLKVIPKELWVWNEQKVIQNLEYVKDYYKKHYV